MNKTLGVILAVFLAFLTVSTLAENQSFKVEPVPLKLVAPFTNIRKECSGTLCPAGNKNHASYTVWGN